MLFLPVCAGTRGLFHSLASLLSAIVAGTAPSLHFAATSQVARSIVVDPLDDSADASAMPLARSWSPFLVASFFGPNFAFQARRETLDERRFPLASRETYFYFILLFSYCS